uniref:Uncharacterized protein n=1 Tax=Marmota marmota marmota TaxID=9994 RepID=A0A8C6A8J8_MARMA
MPLLAAVWLGTNAAVWLGTQSRATTQLVDSNTCVPRRLWLITGFLWGIAKFVVSFSKTVLARCERGERLRKLIRFQKGWWKGARRKPSLRNGSNPSSSEPLSANGWCMRMVNKWLL